MRSTTVQVTSTGGTGTVQQTAYYPDWRYTPVTRPATIGGQPVAWDTPIYHIKVGGLSGSRCEDVAQGIARAVEGERRDVARKPEFFRTPVAQQGRLRV